MTADLGNVFRSAQAASGAWNNDGVMEALKLLAGREFGIDWEPGDEEWGRVVDSGGNVHALVCARIPLGIVREDMDTARMTMHVSWIRVPSMSEQTYTVDRPLLEQVFGRQLSENIDYSKLSINDLWWATVS